MSSYLWVQILQYLMERQDYVTITEIHNGTILIGKHGRRLVKKSLYYVLSCLRKRGLVDTKSVGMPSRGWYHVHRISDDGRLWLTHNRLENLLQTTIHKRI